MGPWARRGAPAAAAWPGLGEAGFTFYFAVRLDRLRSITTYFTTTKQICKKTYDFCKKTGGPKLGFAFHPRCRSTGANRLYFSSPPGGDGSRGMPIRTGRGLPEGLTEGVGEEEEEEEEE